MHVTCRRGALRAPSKLNSIRSVPTRVPIGLPVWTFFKRAPVPNRLLPHDVHFVYRKQVPSLSTRPPLPTPFHDTIWSPLLSAALEIAFDFIIAYLVVLLLRYAAKKANEVNRVCFLSVYLLFLYRMLGVGSWIQMVELDGVEMCSVQLFKLSHHRRLSC